MKTFLIGYTTPDHQGLCGYLRHTEQEAFYKEFIDAIDGGIPPGMALCSFYAKLCYRSLVTGKNQNISRTREIEDNLVATIDQGHGSVFEHCWLNFISTGVSRVFTHELVRHRVGTAFSQTSGRYCTVEDAELVLPAELDSGWGPDDGPSPGDMFRATLTQIKSMVAECRTMLCLDDEKDFNRKKRLTSALRRIMPNGATNEIGWSCNVRSLRHMLIMRTSRHAEWEIRQVFNDVAEIIQKKWPLMLYGLVSEEVDGLLEFTGTKL